MKNLIQRRFLLAIAGSIATAAALSVGASAGSPKIYNDDPVWVERDTEDASSMKPLEVDLMVDLTVNMMAGGRDIENVRAKNLNTVDEVPDSSWFTNRLGRLALTPADIAKGPDTTSGPPAGPWTVTSSKSDGVTPGFTIVDAAGQRWFLKFDPPGHRAMSTGTEVAVTKLMWALGYYVPENHIAYLQRERLVVGKGAMFTPAGGKRRLMKASDIDTLLQRADGEGNGSYRIVASKALQGKPIGRMRFYGTRPDDPNDIVPHEHHRELRGYGVFAAWLNHVDAKAINSLDTLITENGRSYVRHNLIDFGSTLGSGGVAAADHWAGTQYLLEPAGSVKQMFGFGFMFPSWHTAKFYESPAVGRMVEDNTNFNPDLWKPRVPNRAFLHARADDKFWAAQRLVAITDDMLRGAIAAGEFGDRPSEEFLVRALAERRDAIVRSYLTAINPISDPALTSDGVLTFRNAAVDASVAEPPRAYRATWSIFDNTTGDSRRIAESFGQTHRLEGPVNLPSGEGTFLKVELSNVGGKHTSWETPVNAIFRLHAGNWQLVGFERLPEA